MVLRCALTHSLTGCLLTRTDLITGKTKPRRKRVKKQLPSGEEVEIVIELAPVDEGDTAVVEGDAAASTEPGKLNS